MLKLKLVTAVVALLLMAAGVATANDKDKDKNNDGKARTVTGCLSKGESAGEYALAAKDGSTWELRAADGVNLASHVGHTVTITGTASTLHAKAHEMKEKTKDEAAEHGIDKNETEHGHLKATHVKMVSTSCTP